MNSINDLKKIIEETVQEVMNLPYAKVGISNRHIHLSQEDLEILFGKGYELTPTKELLPGQYACAETVNISGPKGILKKVRVLGPVRKETQVEISVTDGFAIGVKPPVNESGDLTGAGTVIIENPQTGAKVEKACAIAALRHIHLTPDFAEKFGLKDKQMVKVQFGGERGLTFNNVLLRVSKDFEVEMHIDTDEGNAGGIKNGDFGLIIAD